MHTTTSLFAGWLPRSDAGRNVLTLGFGHACGHVLLLAATPLLTRLYAPDAFGLFATYNTIVAIWSVVTTLRYEAAIPLAAGRAGAWNLLYVSFAAATFVGGVACASFLLLGNRGLEYLQAPELRSFAVVGALNIAACGGYQAATYWLLRERAFRQLAVARIALSLVTVCGQLGLAALPAGPTGLILGHFIGYCAAFVVAAALILNSHAAPHPSLSGMRSVAARFRRFPLLGTWGALVSILGTLLPTLLVAALFGPSAAGLYLLAHRCLSIPSALVQYPVSRVYLSEAARMLKDDPSGLPKLYRRVAVNLLGFGIPMVLLAMVVAPMAFELCFGPTWRSAGLIARVLAPMMLCQLIWSSAQPTLDVIGRQDLDFGLSVMHMALAVLGLLTAAGCGAELLTAAAMMSISSSAGFAASLVLTSTVMDRSVTAAAARRATSPAYPPTRHCAGVREQDETRETASSAPGARRSELEHA